MGKIVKTTKQGLSSSLTLRNCGILCNKCYKSVYTNKINLGTLRLSCKTKLYYTNHSHITCFARFELLEKLCALPDKSILYFDTDSIIYFSENGDSLIEEGTNWQNGFETQ